MQKEHVDCLLDHHEPRSHHAPPFDAGRTTEVALPYSGEMDHLAERACGSSGLLAFRGVAREVALEDGGVVDLLPRFVCQQRGLVRCSEPLGVSALDDPKKMTPSSSSVRLLTFEHTR
jgi:hypothetical protein